MSSRLSQGACVADRSLSPIVGHPRLGNPYRDYRNVRITTENYEQFSFTGYQLYSIGSVQRFNYCQILLDRRPHRAGVVSLGEMTPAPLLLRTPLTARPDRKYKVKGIRSVFTGLYLYAAVSTFLHEEASMLYWTLVFLVIAIIAGIFGFAGIAVAAAGVAKLLFFIFIVLFLVSLITHFARRSGV